MEHLKQYFIRKLVTLKCNLAVAATFETEKTFLKLRVLISMFCLQCSRSCCNEYSRAQKKTLPLFFLLPASTLLKLFLCNYVHFRPTIQVYSQNFYRNELVEHFSVLARSLLKMPAQPIYGRAVVLLPSLSYVPS